ncbi:MAG: alpha-L-fucosidase [Anaerolineae bacterium]|nr:alpha-L-fucosidase [Anaerolineae bacterium]
MEKYEPNWESLSAYEVPEWFMDGKLGIFIHWGVYAVPAYNNEWYPRFMYMDEVSRKGVNFFEHHCKHWGHPSEFGYKDFIPLFKAEKWDPEAWIELFQEAGATYVVPVAEHHDGFPMYDCSFTNFNAAQMGPCRDVVAELEIATRKAGLKFGVSSHRAHNARYYTFKDNYDTTNPDYHKLYGVPRKAEEPVSYEFVLDWYARTQELIDKFSPDVLWFDFGWHRDEFEPWRPRVAAYYYNHALEHGYEPVLQYKDKIPENAAVLDIERGKLDGVRDHYWQTDTSVSFKSWSYIEDDEFRSVTSLVHDLVDIVSKNGNLLLDIGPKADGTIPQEVQDLLRGLGAWLKLNGEAIYGTRAWTTYGEGPTGIPKAFREQDQAAYSAKDVRFTKKDNVLYATLLGWPGAAATVRTLQEGGPVAAEQIASVALVGVSGELAWSQDALGLTVQFPEAAPCDHAYVLRISLKD